MEDPGTCFGSGSIAGAVIGTFLTTCLLLVVAALVYRQWRRNKGKHLVLVTDPEIVEEAYAFDNPCFKDSTPAVGRSLERPSSFTTQTETTPVTKETGRWSTPWSNLGRHEKRRTLDDSCLGPKATRVSVVGLRSRDFTGLGFNVCGNMREGIFVKDLLHRGPASESGRIHPGDRITSVKISFRSMVYEDALTILSYASPYDVELEVESGGGAGSKPTTLLKKSVGPTPTHICHPLYRSQSIPELSQQQSGGRKYGSGAVASKRLFAADPNDSNYSNYSTMNSTIKSSKSTPGSQTLERRHEELIANKANHQPNQQQQHHPKFGIKVLPALDGTVHRVENQNEHNTNLERRHSKKLEFTEKSNGSYINATDDGSKKVNDNLQQRSAAPTTGKKVIHVTDGVGIDVPDHAAEIAKVDDGKPATLVIPSEVPAEVHNAAMAARRNRKSSSSELLNVQKVQQPNSVEPQQMPEQQLSQETVDGAEAKSPQKGKRKAPAPPSRTASIEVNDDRVLQNETAINDISDYKEDEQTSTNLENDKSTIKQETDEQSADLEKEERKLRQERIKRTATSNRRNSESDTDSEIQNSFTTIELNPADITIHHTPVPDAAANDDEDDDDDMYRKAASLGDLSKYESKTSATLERAQSLDMTDTGSKKRKAPLPPPEDINESTEDLTKLDQIETFDRRKLKKSSEWGTLEDAIWTGPGTQPLEEKISRVRKKSNGSSNGTLERSKSNVEIKIKNEDEEEFSPDRLNVSDGAIETNLELYNLPLSKKLTQDFIRAERLFDPEEDNALSRIVHDGEVIKSPTAEEVEFEFRKSHPLPDEDDDGLKEELDSPETSPIVADSFEKAVRYFDMHAQSSPLLDDSKIHLPDPPEELYAGKKEIVEEPMSKVTLNFGCPACDHGHGRHSENCNLEKTEESETSYHQTIRVEDSKNDAKKPSNRRTSSDAFETHFAKPILNVPEAAAKSDEEDDEDEAAYEFGSAVTVNSKNLSSSPIADKHNVSNVSVSSGENSEDSGLVRGSMEFSSNETNVKRMPASSNAVTPPSVAVPQKMTYITEIKVSPTNRESIANNDEDNALSENEEIVSIMESGKKSAEASSSSSVTLNVTSNGKLPAGKKPPVPPRRSDAARFVPRTDVANPEKQIVYVSEYKSPVAKDDKSGEAGTGKKFDNWVFLKEAGKEKQQEVNPWGNGSSPSQPVTNIVLSSSGDEKIVRK